MIRAITRFVTRAALAALPALAAVVSADAQQTAPAQEPNTLTLEERTAGWRLLFDGLTTAGWRGYQMKEMPAHWKVVDGVLMKERTTTDIVSVTQYGDFEFTMDWLVAPRGNAGLFYRATEEYTRVYWSAHEYQIFTDDTTFADGRNPLTSAGAVYGFYPAPRGVVKPANQWNTARVVAKGNHVEHWLNGVKIAEFELYSPEWEAKFLASKFKPYENFARARKGHIAIQGDHNGVLRLRNIKIRELR
jgi:hypothetical protein